MKKQRKEQDYRHGHLPQTAPLANPYVPFQGDNPPVYEARKGLIRGTMYPGLDLPFRGMVNRQEKPMTPMIQLQTLNFAIQDLALYLDTHRDDKEALALYREYQRMYAHCKQEYMKKRGPLNHLTVSDTEEYAWLDDPWPWEYAKNKEV
ncbi:MAG: spore coat protein CotJB [Oscillospiraceae bacterium]|nr:spore coat protein CotJB [Oscillospiraceae bacterium]